MCIKKNNPGCDPCEPCELQECEGEGFLTNTEVTIANTPATRQFTTRINGVEYQVTYEGYDFINGTYNLTPDENCNYFNLYIEFMVTVTVEWRTIFDFDCYCGGYDQGPNTCEVPMRLIIDEGTIVVEYDQYRQSEIDCTPASIPLFLNLMWNFFIQRDSNWCVEKDSELTLSGGICFTPCLDTAVGINVNWTPTITP